MDVLPVQASAMACKWVFSSSKETCTLRQSWLKPQLLSALQVLKYGYKYSHQLSFVSDLIALEANYTIDGPITEAAVDELLRDAKYNELEDSRKNINISVSTSL